MTTIIHADPLKMPKARPEPDVVVGDVVRRKGEKHRRHFGTVQRITTTTTTLDREWGHTICPPRKVARVEWRRKNGIGDVVVTHTTVGLAALYRVAPEDVPGWATARATGRSSYEI